MKNILQAAFFIALGFGMWYSGYYSGKNAYKDVPMISIPREQWEAIERRSVIYIDTCNTYEFPEHNLPDSLPLIDTASMLTPYIPNNGN